ncbi:MAG: universal stress protein, partial [Chloroflexota bacterium]|nr:universal stress protein [Chloroflexota bacterium]
IIVDTSGRDLYMAKEDFRRARRRAALEAVLARLQGRSADLFSYEDVRRRLKPTGGKVEKGYQEIPLDAIVGSVGRYSDFTRSFLPRQESDQYRWANVKAVMNAKGFDPIEVYEIDDAYFVRDGNHRVSIARQMGLDTIPAYVTEIRTKVPFSREMEPEDLIWQEEYANFLERTQLDTLRPEANLEMSLPGHYRELEEQIEAHRRVLEQREKRSVSFPEAAVEWYDHVYLPVARVIRERGILRDFPGRSETDLYLWISEHRDELERAIGWGVPTEDVAADLVAQASPQPERLVARLSDKVKDALTPTELESGPAPGEWRRERVEARERAHLFSDVVVGLSGEEVGWNALEQALVVAKREQGRLLGVHVVPSEEEAFSAATEAMQARFRRRVEEAGVPGHLVVTAGRVVSTLCERARWADLLVLNLAYPPPPQPLARLKSGFSSLIRRCSRPLLVVPSRTTGLNSALLAYDGSAKAEEALYIATYLAGSWDIPLVVLTVDDGQASADTLDHARTYITERGVQATFVQKQGAVAESILQSAEEFESELILMGGYGLGSVREVVLGSSVNQVLRQSQRPMLISR